MRQDLVQDPAELRDCLEIALVADAVDEDLAFAPFEKVRVSAKYPRLVEGALPQVRLELPHQCRSATSGRSESRRLSVSSPIVPPPFRKCLWLAGVERHEALLNLVVVRDHRHRLVAAGRLKLRVA